MRLRTLLQAAAAEKKTPVRAAISNESARVSQNGWETECRRRQNNPLNYQAPGAMRRYKKIYNGYDSHMGAVPHAHGQLTGSLDP